MNYQNVNKGLQMYPASKAAEELECSEDELSYYAWPQVFGSTSGPFGGIGGQAMSTYTIEAWVGPLDVAVFFSNGRRLECKEFKGPNYNQPNL